MEVKPITGSWVNLAWKDVRNKYTNPQDRDMTDPAMWRRKVREWHDMGLEYLIFLEVANEGEAYYPSDVMPHIYPEGTESPVVAIMNEAAAQGMKVFLSTGWARNQDEDVRDPWVQGRQAEIMEELAALYGDSPAFYGWYLPVEDCITPVFPKTAVEAVNALVERSRELTPGKKTLISPYGMVYARYDLPEFAENIRSLKVDIIAYQDEVGCVREQFPLPHLRNNWKQLRKVHDGTSIQMWANCETFTWEGNTNDRTSALIPAAYSRLLAQQTAASEGGVERIVSFMFGGIIENPDSPFRLGTGDESTRLYRDYMAWRDGDKYWKMVEKSYRGLLEGSVKPLSASIGTMIDCILGEEDLDTSKWRVYEPGETRISIELPEHSDIHTVLVRAIDYGKWGIFPPEEIRIENGEGETLATRCFDAPGDNRHDAWIDFIDIDLDKATEDRLIISFNTNHKVLLDEIIINPR